MRKIFYLYIIFALLVGCGIGYLIGIKFHDQTTPSAEASAVPPGWYAHKMSIPDEDPSILDYTILTRQKDLPPPKNMDGAWTDDDIYINVMTTTSTPEEYVAQQGLSGPDAEMVGVQGTWGTFFSYKTFSVGTLLEGPGNLVMLFNGNKVESFSYNNSADASDFWKVITYYAQHPSYD
jgi:hypothetical protein